MTAQGELTHKIIGAFFDVYNDLRAGFLECVYKSAMAMAPEDTELRGATPPSTGPSRGASELPPGHRC